MFYIREAEEISEVILSLEGIEKSFGDVPVLRGISLDVHKGEFLTLLGPSGCGKTTTLRIIAGLETPDGGRVVLNGTDVTALAPEKRSVNTVFQNYALFPHMNVQRNIAYGLKLRGVPKETIRGEVARVLDLVKLPGYERRMPDQLSGGQRQRVAIARAVVLGPSLLLLDEPLGALDLQLRRQMQEELKALQSDLGITFIYITHDQEEALNMSDRIAVMNEGAFEQIGSPDDIYERPATRFAAGFIGQSNIVECTVESVQGDYALARHPAGAVRVHGQNLAKGQHLALSVRAERIDYRDETDDGFDLDGTIRQHSYIGGVLRTIIVLNGGQELFITGANPVSQYPPGCAVKVFWDPEAAAIVERGTPDGA